MTRLKTAAVATLTGLVALASLGLFATLGLALVGMFAVLGAVGAVAAGVAALMSRKSTPEVAGA